MKWRPRNARERAARLGNVRPHTCAACAVVSHLQAYPTMTKVAVAFALSLTACAFGAPPGFSQGDTWTFPLVEPGNGGRLLTPVMIEGKGPYLFAIDPDAPMTTVDPDVLRNTEFRIAMGARRLDEQDTTHPSFYTRITHLQAGDLTVSLLAVAEAEGHAFDTDGRRIYGILGRDVIADSLVFGFDRDKGIAWLQTQEAFHAPAGAQTLDYRQVRDEPINDPRRLLATNVNGHPVDLHLDLGEAVSQLYPNKWAAAELQPLGWHLVLVDGIGHKRDVDQLGIAQQVKTGGVTRDHVAFAPYDDRRFTYNIYDGTLGLDFFQPFDVAVNWHTTRLYLTPRTELPLEQRIARWGWKGCADASCFQLSLSSAADQPKPTLRVARDPAVAGEVAVIVKATGSTGTPLPSFEATFPAGVNELSTQLDTQYTGARLEISDASPFARKCADPRGCVIIEAATPP